jgi:hypothetical protein
MVFPEEHREPSPVLHFIAIDYDGKTYRVYNRWTQSNTFTEFNSIEEAIGGEERFHYAYIPH